MTWQLVMEVDCCAQRNVSWVQREIKIYDELFTLSCSLPFDGVTQQIEECMADFSVLNYCIGYSGCASRSRI